MNTELQKNHYKENSPEETVARLKDILNTNGIEVEEEWMPESHIHTHSLRLNFKGTTKGANGKGVTKAYAQASAYAEFFERYQNGILINPRYIPKSKSAHNFLVAADEKYMSSLEIVKQNDPFMKMYFSRREMDNASDEEKASAFLETNRIDYLISGNIDQYTCLPFYNVRTHSVQYLPHWTYCMYYGSNGMAAGNSPWEAIVQGLSEIYERVVQKALFSLTGGLPDVPDEYLMQYPELYERYLTLKNIPGYDVHIKDCSFEGKYPVVGLLIIQHDTCKYGIKLGCHPDFGIALERTLTEATQGTDILKYVERSSVDFFNKKVSNWVNMTNSFKVGLAQFPYQILSDKPVFKFTPARDISNLSNKELCNKMINDLIESGNDILIRDVSTFGFPSYHIIVPTLSELIDASDDKIRAYNTRSFSSVLINNPHTITSENCKYIIASIGYFSNSLMENSLESYYQDTSEVSLPFSSIGASAIYLAATCHILCGDYLEAHKKLLMIQQYAKSAGLPDSEYMQLLATTQYTAAMCAEKDHLKAMEYMRILFNQSICKKLDDVFGQQNDVITKQFPSATTLNTPTMERIYAYADILKNEQLKNPINQLSLSNLFDTTI